MIAVCLLLAVLDDGPIEVRARWIDPPPHFVNQTIGVEVTAAGAGPGASVVPSRVVGGTIAAGPVRTSVDGGLVATFGVVAGRSGPLRVPPFTLKRGGAVRGRSGSLSTTVRDLPASGRTRAFLGGVGTLETVEAEAVPAEIRVGDSFEYRLRMVGTAAVGSARAPDFSGWERLPLGLRIDPPRTELVGDSESESESERVVTVRVRATVAGSADLPSISVAAFDPKTQVYRTWRSPRVAVAVAAAPTFDAGRLEYGASASLAPTPPPRRSIAWLAVGLSVLLVLIAVGLVGLGVRRWREPGRPARRALRSLWGVAEPSILANRVESGLIAYLERASGRPPGALTPLEARSAFETLILDPERAEQARRVLELADQARYSGRGIDVEALRAEAVALFQALGKRRPGIKNHGDRRQV